MSDRADNRPKRSWGYALLFVPAAAVTWGVHELAHWSAGELLGYAVPAEGPGYMDTVGLIYGYEPRSGTIVGVAILESRETPGLGDKIITDPAFHENFRRLSVEPVIVPVKKGRKQSANEVDCITGATISSKAIVNILNEAVDATVGSP